MMQRDTYQPSVKRPPEKVLSNISPTVATITSATQPNNEPDRERDENAMMAPARLTAATRPPTMNDGRLKRPWLIGATGSVSATASNPAATTTVIKLTAIARPVRTPASCTGASRAPNITAVNSKAALATRQVRNRMAAVVSLPRYCPSPNAAGKLSVIGRTSSAASR